MYKNKYKKAITFSFDDGTKYDIRLVELFNKYGIKCTFNLNSGKMTEADAWLYGDTIVRHLNYIDIKEKDLYKGHEIACHTLTHPFPDRLDYRTTLNEIVLDKKVLSTLTDKPIIGFAYPYGTVTENAINALKECGLKYARTVGQTLEFDLPDDLYRYRGTCHFNHPDIYKIAERFLALNPDEDKVFYIWGHSYELEANDLWEKFEEFLKYISNKTDIYYCTNSEAFHLEGDK